MSKEIIISCKKVTYYYNMDEGKNIIALNNIDLDVYKGEFLAILGHNGSGKSTLSKLFNGLIIPVEGKVYVDGLDTSEENNIWEIRKKVGMVFQNPDNQIVATIVEEDVAFGPENMGVKPEDIRKRVDESLKIVNMYKYRKHAPHLLSGGQKQRVAIAGILAMKTNCIIFDESTAMLDPNGRKEVINTIMDLNKNYGITIILITHHMEEVIDAHRVIVLNEGSIAMEGTPKEVFSQVELVKDLGLDVPQVTELAYELQKEGIPIDCHIINIDEMVDKLCTLK